MIYHGLLRPRDNHVEDTRREEVLVSRTCSEGVENGWGYGICIPSWGSEFWIFDASSLVQSSSVCIL